MRCAERTTKNSAEQNSAKRATGVDIEIARADYLPIGYDSSLKGYDNSLKGFPVRILMKAKDGTSMLYKRCE